MVFWFSYFMKNLNVILEKTSKESIPLLDIPDTSWLIECKEEHWDGVSSLSTGMYVSTVGSTEYHFCFFRSEADSSRVIVSLTSGGYGNTREDGPRFNRWKYSDETDASILCIDDPMVYLHSINYGWFAGDTADGPMWESLGKLVVSVCHAAGIESPNVMFLSSSSGGVGSILASSTIGIPCTVVAIHPQMYLRNATKYRGYMKKGYICKILKEPNHIFDIIRDHKENRYVIMENVSSDLDYDRYFSNLCEYMSIEPTYGITHRSNLVTWVYNAPTSKPHSSVDWKAFYPAIEYVVDNFDRLDSVPRNMLRMFTTLLEEHHALVERVSVLEKTRSESKNGGTSKHAPVKRNRGKV